MPLAPGPGASVEVELELRAEQRPKFESDVLVGIGFAIPLSPGMYADNAEPLSISWATERSCCAQPRF